MCTPFTRLLLLALLFASLTKADEQARPVFQTRGHEAYNVCVLLKDVVATAQGQLRQLETNGQVGLTLTISKDRFWVLRHEDRELGEGPLGGAKQVLIKCRGKSLSLYGDTDKLSSHTLDDPPGGNWFADPALRQICSELYGQRVSRIAFDDDFAREDGSMGVWDDPADAFGVTLAPQLGAAMNAFWYRGESETRACSLAGYDFWDAYSYRAALKRLDAEGDCGIVVGATETHAGWAFISRRDRVLLVSLENPNRALAAAPCRLRVGQWYALDAHMSDTHLRLFIDDTLLIEHAAHLPGGRLGVLVAGTAALFDDISVRSIAEQGEHDREPAQIPEFFKTDPYMRAWTQDLSARPGDVIRDLFFTRQPVDWIVREGQWESFSRWACKPKWAFFGAAAQTQTRVSYKRPIQGDFTIDLFAAPPMFARRSPLYNFPLNLQIMIQPQGAGSGSGYRFVYGFYDVPSFIECDGVVQGGSAQQVRYNLRHGFGGDRSMNRLIHRRWAHLTVARRDGTLSLSADGARLVTVDDPSPIDGGLVSVAAWRNGASIARVRIASEAIGPSVSPSAAVYATQMPESALTRGMDLRWVQDLKDMPVPPAHMGTPTDDGRAWQMDFSKGLPPWAIVRGAEGASVILKQAPGVHFARLVNTRFGGAMAMRLWRGDLPLESRPRLTLGYRVPVWMKCNIRCQLDDNEWLEIPFLDRSQVTFSPRRAVRGQNSTSEWHQVEIDLSARLHRSSGSVRQIVLADSDHSSSYLGSFYDLRTVQVGAATPLAGVTTREHSEPSPLDRDAYGAVLHHEDMEGDMPHITSWDGVSFMPVERSAGGHGLWLFPRELGPDRCSVVLYDQAYRPSQYPFLHVEYRSRRRSCSLSVVVGQQLILLRNLRLNPDGEWHRLSLDMKALLSAKLPDGDPLAIEEILLGLSSRAHLEIDNLVISDGEAPMAER